MTPINLKDIEAYYQFLAQERTELRAIDVSKKVCVLKESVEVTNSQDFLAFCSKWNGLANVCAGIHERHPHGTKSADVKQITIVGLDIDAVRPRHEAASEGELSLCREAVYAMLANLEPKYGKPTIIMTGNGYQLLWKIHPIPLTDANRQVVEKKLQGFITGIRKRYAHPAMKIDQVGDLSRILKVPGTLSVKGTNTEERPYRVAQIIHLNTDLSENLRDELLLTEPENRTEQTQKVGSTKVKSFNQLLKKDKKLKDLYAGKWQKYGYQSLSEAELVLVSKLVYYGYGDKNIDGLMHQAGIGKWKEAGESYKRLTLANARLLAAKLQTQQEDRIGSPTSLADVYRVFQNWLYIDDTKRIDVMLAIALSQRLSGTPLWLIFIGPSGDGKTEFVRSLEGLDIIYKIQQFTENTLVSGNPLVEDLAPRLHNKLVLVTDFASILSLKSDKKREIWAQLRNLYDGEAYKESGSGAIKRYDNLRVTFLACSTPAIDSQILIHQDLGTRELIYRTNGSAEHHAQDSKVRKALLNETQEEMMRTELKEIVRNFLFSVKELHCEVPESIQAKLMEHASLLSVMRACANVDSYSGELIDHVTPEVPTRLIKQLKRLYLMLKSLDNDYADERAMEVIAHIVKSSCKETRIRIYDMLKESDTEYTTSQIAENVKLGKKTVQTELQSLWSLNLISRRTQREILFGKECEIHYWSMPNSQNRNTIQNEEEIIMSFDKKFIVYHKCSIENCPEYESNEDGEGRLLCEKHWEKYPRR